MITVGATVKKPMVVDDEVKIRDVVNVTLTLDHRYTDGARAGQIYKKFRDFLHDPEGFSAKHEHDEIEAQC